MDESATTRNIAWFNREKEDESLDLNPEFQRKPVWKEEQEAYLIDSILNGLPIPEIYMRTITSPDGASKYEVVDGQQRIRAILKFARNDLVLEGEDISERWRGLEFQDLGDETKESFWSYPLAVRELGPASDAEIRDMFRRLNVNVVELNDQELRHATYQGRFISVVEDLADDEWWLDHRIVSVRAVRRMRDAEFISELLVALIAGPQDKKKTLDDFYRDYDENFPDEDHWIRTFEDTRDLIDETLSENELRDWRSKTDFYTLFSVFGLIVKNRIDLNEDQKEQISDALSEFMAEVTEAKRADTNGDFAGPIAEYAEAALRATTDIDRRTTREKILTDLIETTIDIDIT